MSRFFVLWAVFAISCAVTVGVVAFLCWLMRTLDERFGGWAVGIAMIVLGSAFMAFVLTRPGVLP